MSDHEETPGTQHTQSPTSSTASTSTYTNVPHSGLPPFPPFDPLTDPASVGLRWRKWTRRFKNLLISLREFDPTVPRGLLLTYVGEATNDIFDTLSDTGTTYETAITRLTDHFDPIRNKAIDIAADKSRTRRITAKLLPPPERESNSLRIPNQDAEIKTQIIHHTSDSQIHRKALREPMDLKALVDYRYALEKSDLDSKRIENGCQNATINYTGRQPKEKPRGRTRQHQKQPRNPHNPQAKPENNQQARKCMHCGGPFPHNGGRDACPTSGVKCNACSKTGHFAKCCLSKPKQRPRRHNVREISQVEKPAYLSDTDEEFVYAINAQNKQPETITKITNIPVKVILATGSSVNLLNNSIFKKIQQENATIKLETSPYHVFPYGADKPIELLGQFTAEIKSDTITKTDKFLVTKTNSKCVLSYRTCTALELLDVKINANTLEHVNPEITQILHKYKGMFEGMGNIKNIQVTLDIDPSIQPVTQRPYRIPHSMKTAVNSKLEQMRKQGTIEKVEGSTPWLSPIIATPKKGGDVRLVLDMRVRSQALTQRRVQIQTVDEILQKMEGATIFTKVD